jgi:L-aminopeptidase/D-esterase-like protein
LKIGAIVVVNAIGDVFDHKTGKKIAGLLNEDKTGFRSAYEVMGNTIRARDNKFTDNTTIGVVITNAKFDKSQLSKIAGMAHDGYARSISPVHTSADGDTIYAVSTGEITADQDLVGVIVAEVMSEAIEKAVES